MADHRINVDKLPRVVELNVGDTFVIDLRENPTTGYRWQASPASQLVPSGDEFLAQGNAAAGSSGVRTLKFTPLSVGKGTVMLELRREWETGAPQQSVTIAYEAK